MADPTSTTSNRYEWIGSSGGLWSSAANWKDSTAGTSPARFVPGTSNPVTISEPTGASYEVVSGGGGAASMGLTGNVSLVGGYTVGGALNVGSLPAAAISPVAGSLALAANDIITVGSVNVLGGTLSLGVTAGMFSTGSVTVGLPDGVLVDIGDGFNYPVTASGTINLAAIIHGFEAGQV